MAAVGSGYFGASHPHLGVSRSAPSIASVVLQSAVEGQTALSVQLGSGTGAAADQLNRAASPHEDPESEAPVSSPSHPFASSLGDLPQPPSSRCKSRMISVSAAAEMAGMWPPVVPQPELSMSQYWIRVTVSHGGVNVSSAAFRRPLLRTRIAVAVREAEQFTIDAFSSKRRPKGSTAAAPAAAP
eukprot:3655728-Prymnesium_polylepis.1